MIGTFCGLIEIRFMKFWIIRIFNNSRKLTISETILNLPEKISWSKISKDKRNNLRKKVSSMKLKRKYNSKALISLLDTTFTPSPTVSQVITPSLLKNLRNKEAFGSWSPSEKVRAKVFFCWINCSKLHNGKMISAGNQTPHRQSPMSFKSILWIRYWSAVKSLICVYMCL